MKKIIVLTFVVLAFMLVVPSCSKSQPSSSSDNEKDAVENTGEYDDDEFDAEEVSTSATSSGSSHIKTPEEYAAELAGLMKQFEDAKKRGNEEEINRIDRKGEMLAEEIELLCKKSEEFKERFTNELKILLDYHE